MRFNDHRGLIPQQMKLLAGGLRGSTKTTGAGKHREELEVVVDRSAFVLVDNWLEASWHLWDGLYPDRDFFVWGSHAYAGQHEMH